MYCIHTFLSVALITAGILVFQSSPNGSLIPPQSLTENPCVLPEKLQRFYPTLQHFPLKTIRKSFQERERSSAMEESGNRSTGKNERQGSGFPSAPLSSALLSSVPPYTSTETVSQKSTAAVRVTNDDQDCIAVFGVCLGTSNHSGRLIYARTVMIPQPIVTAAVHVLKRDDRGKLRKPTLPTQGRIERVPR